MDSRALPRILRIEGLIPFTLCAILIGFVVSLWEAGFKAADWSLFFIAAVTAVLIHIDGHLWNDIMDLEIDRREKSRETGRDRPLVYGWATVREYRTISAIVISVIIVLAAYLTIYRVFIPLLVILGFFFDYGYNHPRLALAHHPYTEWYIFPWLVVGVTVTVVYAATGIISMLAIILSLLHGMIVTCFVVSMMRRDVNSDRLGAKCTSSVLSPELPHSTRYGVITMFVAALMIYPLDMVLGNLRLAYILVLATTITAGINTVLGARIDQLCTRTLISPFSGFESDANTLMLKQVAVSISYAVVMCIMVVVFGGIL